MTKRKASNDTLSNEPARRRLRSGGAVAETPVGLSTKRCTRSSGTLARKMKIAQTFSNTYRTREQSPSVASTSTPKQNKTRTHESRRGPPQTELSCTRITASEDELESDELDFLPTVSQSTRPSTPSKRTPRREIMHSVEIVTPRMYIARAIGSSMGSPRSYSLDKSPTAKEKTAIGLVPNPLRVTPTPHKRVPLAPATSAVDSEDHSMDGLLPTADESVVAIPIMSPSKSTVLQDHSLYQLPDTLPPHLHSCLSSQRATIMAALRNPPELNEDDCYDENVPSTNLIAYKNICDLLIGTVNRGEGNSCLIIGPRGSGKTRLVDRALDHVSDKISPIVIRLSGHAQVNDRLAIREIAWQLTQQTGKTFLSVNEDEPDGDSDEENLVFLPPAAHLPALISVLPSQPRPVIVILDAFDSFALHGRQALLYCLLDTAQSCRVGEAANGIAVIGVTSRVDSIDLLEKRVKSRFSGRIFRTTGVKESADWAKLTRRIFMANVESDHAKEWLAMWEASVDRFLNDQKVIDAFHETWALSNDLRVLVRILTALVLKLTPDSPFPSLQLLVSSIATQRCSVRFSYLSTLSYPSICLLITAIHSQTSGHDTFTFEMLCQAFRDQVRTSMSAPVQVDGGSVGMVKCSRHVLMGAFEQLAASRIFVPVIAPSANVGKEFIKYRCTVDRDDVKKAIEKIGQTNLKKWFAKSQQSG